jgi:hypothetical protein
MSKIALVYCVLPRSLDAFTLKTSAAAIEYFPDRPVEVNRKNRIKQKSNAAKQKSPALQLLFYGHNRSVNGSSRNGQPKKRLVPVR